MHSRDMPQAIPSPNTGAVRAASFKLKELNRNGRLHANIQPRQGAVLRLCTEVDVTAHSHFMPHNTDTWAVIRAEGNAERLS